MKPYLRVPVYQYTYALMALPGKTWVILVRGCRYKLA